ASDDDLRVFRKQIGDRPQLLHRSFSSEDAGSGISPACDIGLRNSGFDLAGGDHAEIFDRALCRLGHCNKAGNTAIAAMLARRQAGGFGDGAGDHPADLEERTGGRGGAYTKEPCFLCTRRCELPKESESEHSGHARAAPPNAESSGHRLTGETTVPEDSTD